jgi:hypothetical protein
MPKQTETTHQSFVYSLCNDAKAEIYKILGCNPTPIQNAQVHGILEGVTDRGIRTMSETKTTPSLARKRFFRMMDDFIFQVEDDVLREKLENALKRERARHARTN